MQSRAPLRAPARRTTHPNWNVTVNDGNTIRYPAREIWIKKGGATSGGSGPSGWKARKSRMLARSLAERTHGK